MQVIKQLQHELRLLDELLLIANNSKGFANGRKSIIRNTLGLRKRSDLSYFKLSKTLPRT